METNPFKSKQKIAAYRDGSYLNRKMKEYMKEYRHILIVSFPVVLALLFTIIAIIYGIKKAIKILSPPIIGIIIAIGFSTLIFGELNLFSIITLFLILGFTMDYSIFRANNGENCEDSILTSALTTSISFLLLAFAGFKLLSIMAVVLFFGIITSYISGYLIFKKEIDMVK